MSVHRFESVQRLPISLSEAWDFFSSPANLKQITPDYMGFDILSGFDINEKMYAGMMIQYTVKPLFNLPMRWVTEITHVSEPHFFVDEQRFGPYSLWHHQHHFKEIKGGIEMKDIVHYQAPLGFIGDVMNTLMIRNKLKEIFDFRGDVLTKKFGSLTA